MANGQVACKACRGENHYTAATCAHCSARIGISGAESDDAAENTKAVLGCVGFLVITGFAIWFIWSIFFTDPSAEQLQRRAEARQELSRQRAMEQLDLQNLRAACDAGVASACVEYAKMID